MHPLTPHDVQCLTSLHEVATRGNGRSDDGEQGEDGETQEPTIKEEEEEEEVSRLLGSSNFKLKSSLQDAKSVGGVGLKTGCT